MKRVQLPVVLGLLLALVLFGAFLYSSNGDRNLVDGQGLKLKGGSEVDSGSVVYSPVDRTRMHLDAGSPASCKEELPSAEQTYEKQLHRHEIHIEFYSSGTLVGWDDVMRVRPELFEANVVLEWSSGKKKSLNPELWGRRSVHLPIMVEENVPPAIIFEFCTGESLATTIVGVSDSLNYEADVTKLIDANRVRCKFSGEGPSGDKVALNLLEFVSDFENLRIGDRGRISDFIEVSLKPGSYSVFAAAAKHRFWGEFIVSEGSNSHVFSFGSLVTLNSRTPPSATDGALFVTRQDKPNGGSALFRRAETGGEFYIKVSPGKYCVTVAYHEPKSADSNLDRLRIAFREVIVGEKEAWTDFGSELPETGSVLMELQIPRQRLMLYSIDQELLVLDMPFPGEMVLDLPRGHYRYTAYRSDNAISRRGAAYSTGEFEVRVGKEIRLLPANVHD